MQQILSFQMVPYFAFGQSQKSSLIAQFCRQNNYQHLKNPIFESIQDSFSKHTIIQGSVELFQNLQPIRPQLRVIFIGNNFSEQQISIRSQYRKIGKCTQSTSKNYQDFRKAMFPNIIFIYAPMSELNKEFDNYSQALSRYNGYVCVNLPKNANQFIQEFNKTVNYIVNGVFTCQKQLAILQKYFNIKIVHLLYNRVDLPEEKQFFDKQFQLVSYLKKKQFYYSVKGQSDRWKTLKNISKALSPQLIYLLLDTGQKRNYVDQYVSQTKSIVLSILEIQSINKRKNVTLALTQLQKERRLSQIIYNDFSLKQIFIMDYPYTFEEVYSFQNTVAPFSKFIDLVDLKNNDYHKFFTAEMYFLQNQKRISPRIDVPLQYEISDNVKYWVLNGPPGSGKTTIAKILNAQYNLKHIQFQPYLASVKQKLMGPQDADELPLKKIFAHFKALVNNDIQNIYVIDSLPYQNKDWISWIQQVGQPSIINIQCGEVDSIKRTRKKNQADVNAQITEQELAKAKQSFAKTHKNIQIAKQLIPSIQVLQLSFSGPLILAQKNIHEMFRKRIFLIRDSEDQRQFTFHNIAIKNNLDVINLNSITTQSSTPLRQCLSVVRKCKRKDIILHRYKQTNQKLISQDMYWIQKNLGDIRYLAVWNQQPTTKQQSKIVLEKPIVEEKKKIQGEGQQKPVQQVQKPASFDIYSYEWSNSSSYCNLSQWFFKLKSNVKKLQNSRKQCYKQFGNIYEQIKTSNTCFYEKIV